MSGRGAERGVRRFARLVRAQLVLVGRGPGPAVTLLLLLAVLPLAGALRGDWISGGQLISGLIQLDERFLPLGALLLAAGAWQEAEGGHRALWRTWPLGAAEAVASKSAAWLLAYLPAAMAAAVAYPWLAGALLAGGDPASAGRGRVQTATLAVPVEDFLWRALAPALLLGALVSLGGALGSVWAGTGAGFLLWLANVQDGEAIRRVTCGGLHLFTWSQPGTACSWQGGWSLADFSLLQIGVGLLILTVAGLGLWRARKNGGLPRLASAVGAPHGAKDNGKG